MKRTSRLLRKFLTGGAILFLVSIIFLEVGSRYYKCPNRGQNDPWGIVCNPSHYPANSIKIQAMQGLFESIGYGVEPSRKDLDKVINLVEYQDMDGLNGTVCNEMIFVRDNLSNEGKYFVARHELEHLLMENGINSKCSDEEYCATIRAARIYPIGFIETILSSLYISAKESPTIWCFLFGSWNIFRVYILGL